MLFIVAGYGGSRRRRRAGGGGYCSPGATGRPGVARCSASEGRRAWGSEWLIAGSGPLEAQKARKRENLLF